MSAILPLIALFDFPDESLSPTDNYMSSHPKSFIPYL